ncbi:MAG: hypothetical protein HUK28_04410 [Methanobrevibacter sp.]|nr:hypothetical protein [Methanobrevibacter sp.]
MICPNCKREYYGGYDKYCTECGTPLIRNRRIGDYSRKRKREEFNQSKIDIIIAQNNRIIELLEDLNESHK